VRYPACHPASAPLRAHSKLMSSDLVAAVAAIKADGKRTSPDDVLSQLQATDAHWAHVTLSQVRRAITTAKAATPPLDAESEAERRRSKERERDRERDRSKRQREYDNEARVERRRDAKADKLKAIDDRDFAALQYELSQSTLRLSVLHTLETEDGWHDTDVHGITCTPSGELLLACTRYPRKSSTCANRTPEHFIHVLSATGHVVGTIGEGCLNLPTSITCDKHHVYVVSFLKDGWCANVQQFNLASREFVKSLPFSQELGSPRHLRAIGDRIYVATTILRERNARVHIMGSDMVIASRLNVVRWPPPLDVRDKPTDSAPDRDSLSSVQVTDLCSHGDELFVMVHGHYDHMVGYSTGCDHIQVFSIKGSFIRAIRLPNGSKRWSSSDDPLQGFRPQMFSTQIAIIHSATYDEPVLAVNGSRPFGEWGKLEQILLLSLDGTPLDRLRVVPYVKGMCSSDGALYVVIDGKDACEGRMRGLRRVPGGPPPRPRPCLPCQLQRGVAMLKL